MTTPSMPEREYRPVDCLLHDQLESAATLRKKVRIAFRDSTGGSGQLEDRIVDVYTRAGAEYVKLEGGREIRLDDLQEVNGISFD
jgi:Rho-binding antiterminator